MKTTIAVIIIIILFIAGIAIGYYAAPRESKTTVTITGFAAGSLKYAIGNNFIPEFSNLTGIKIGMSFGGSVSGARQIQSGQPYDIFISAAAGVIPSMLMPNYTNWMIIFATNEMAITWINQSYNIQPGAFWFENISAKGVIVAASNASLDPSGFQAIEMIKLAGIYYTNWSNPYVRMAWDNNFHEFMIYNRAWNSWFGPNGTLASEHYGGNYPINDSMALYDQLFQYKLKVGDLKLTTVEIGLDGYLESGAADYALTYKSQAINQHLYYFKNANGSNGLSSWINLGSIQRNQVMFYQEVNSTGPSIDNIGNYPGGPILYGATILSKTKYLNNDETFIYFLVTSLGQQILNNSDFDPISVPFVYGQPPSLISQLGQPVPAYIPTNSYEEI